MTWYNESETERQGTREWLKEQFPGEGALVVATFDIAWSGWECDWKGALVTHGGIPELVIVDGTSMVGILPDELQQRVRDYRRMADETEAALRRYRELGGLFGDAWQEAKNVRHQRVIALDRHEEETEEEHRARVARCATTEVDHESVTSDLITTIDLSRRPALAAEVERATGDRELRRDTMEADAQYADRKAPFESDGSVVLDVAALYTENVDEIQSTFDAMIDVGTAAELMNTSPELVLHRVRIGDLHLSRREVVALEVSERPRREALAELARLEEERAEPTKDEDCLAGDTYDPAAIDLIRDLKPQRERPRGHVVDVGQDSKDGQE